MKVPVNRDLIADQMNALGLSERRVATQLSMTPWSFRDARLRGYLHGHVSLRQSDELARLLGVELHLLLTTPDAERPSKSDSDRAAPDVASDVEFLLPLLFAAPRLLEIGHLARTLDWHRNRLGAAIDAIPTALAGTGMRLVRSGTSVAVQPALRTDKKVQRHLSHVQSRNAGLSVPQAKMLRRITLGEKVTVRQNSNPDRVTLGALKNMGCIRLGEGASWEQSSHINIALMMAD